MRVKKISQLPKLEVSSVDDVKEAAGIMTICQLYLVRESRTLLEEKAKAAGLNWDAFLEKRPQSAFLDALQSLEEGGILRQVEDTFEHITYQICAEKVTKDQAQEFPELLIGKKAVIRYWKAGRSNKAGMIESDVPEIAESVRQLVIIEQEMVRTPEITGAIKRIIKTEADCVSMSNSGGMWFLAPQFVGLIKKIESFVKSLSGSNQFFYFPVMANSQNQGNIWSAFAADVRSKIKEMKANGSKVAELLLKSEKAPQNRIETVKKSYSCEKERVRSYAELLHQSADKILEELEKEEKDFLTKINITS